MNNNFFNQPVFPMIKVGEDTFKLTSYSQPIACHNAKGIETFYITLTGILSSGRTYKFNIFEQGWNIEFMSPMQHLLNPDNSRSWSTLRDFMDEIIKYGPIKCWFILDEYLVGGKQQSQLRLKFRQPLETKAQPSPIEPDEIEDEALPF